VEHWNRIDPKKKGDLENYKKEIHKDHGKEIHRKNARQGVKRIDREQDVMQCKKNKKRYQKEIKETTNYARKDVFFVFFLRCNARKRTRRTMKPDFFKNVTPNPN
jgi:hypothetical protein